MGVFSFTVFILLVWSSIVVAFRLGGAGVSLLQLRLGVTGAQWSSSLSLGGSDGSAHRSLPWSLSSLGGTAAAAHSTPSLSLLSSLSVGTGAGSAHRSLSWSLSSLGGMAAAAHSTPSLSLLGSYGGVVWLLAFA